MVIFMHRASLKTCKVEFPMDQSLIPFSSLFISTLSMNLSYLMAFNGKYVSITPKFSSLQRCLFQTHAFICKYLLISISISKINLKHSMSQTKLVAPLQIFFISADAKSFQLPRQLWSYSWLLPLFHIPLWSDWKCYLFYI